MNKYLLVAVLFVTIVIHLLTPDWVLTDFNQLGDWIIILLLLSNCIFIFSDSRSLNKTLLLLSIIFSILFYATTMTYGEEDPIASNRMFEILRVDISITPTLADKIGVINFISISIFITLEIIALIMGIKFFVSKRRKI
jgi:hypothetical protein